MPKPKKKSKFKKNKTSKIIIAGLMIVILITAFFILSSKNKNKLNIIQIEDDRELYEKPAEQQEYGNSDRDYLNNIIKKLD